jgi:hypothetical protein
MIHACVFFLLISRTSCFSTGNENEDSQDDEDDVANANDYSRDALMELEGELKARLHQLSQVADLIP